MVDAYPLTAAADSTAVLAVKDLARAKSRLADDVGADDRELLVLAMFADTIGAVRAARRVGRIIVVTPDARVAAVAARAGAVVLAEPVPISPDATSLDPTSIDEASLNAAYRRAANLPNEAASTVVALQADLPALTAAELDAAIAAAPAGRSVVIDHTGIGTTALIARGRGIALEPMFGPRSARRHLDSGATPLGGSAAAPGGSAAALGGAAWPGLRTDVDTLDDLRRVIDIGVGQHTRRRIDRLAVTGRVGRSRRRGA